VLLTARMDHKLESVGKVKAVLSGLLAIGGMGLTLYALSTFPFKPSESTAAYDIKAIGMKLLSYGDYGYVLPFEVISILLLAAMVAAIIIAKKSVSND
jgi:NADH-quinone oxidoreductase subunit J